MDIKNIENIFFLGIGGIGMSALARYFHARGVRVAGYDKTSTTLTRSLQQQGIDVVFDDNASLLPHTCQLVIVTPAVPVSGILYQEACRRNIKILKRAQVLGELSAEIPTIAVAGTHGKTTISTMIAHLLKSAAIPFTAFLGGISTNYNTNFLEDEQPAWMVVEADEFDRSFLHLCPDIAVISSIDADHLDIYGTKEALAESFTQFAKKINPKGNLILKKGIRLNEEIPSNTLSYNLNAPADFFPEEIFVRGNAYYANINGLTTIKDLMSGLPGKHNLENALAAIAVAYCLGIDKRAIHEAFRTFKGVKRRFEEIYRDENMVYIDDYAHHPEELKACISSARELFPDRKITGIFQPHLFSRTRDLAEGFAESLALLDELLLLDIYPAREEPIEGITSAWLLEKVKLSNKCLVKKEDVPYLIKGLPLEVLLSLGAGDIDQITLPIKEVLTNRKA